MSENIIETESQDDLVTTDGAERESTEVVSNIVLESSKPDGVDNEISLDENLETAEDAETFPRSYVEKLRKEAAGHRDRAKRADGLAQRLHFATVEATGRLADARDLPFDESYLDDPVALSGAIDALLADKPHLATRKPSGNIGQGVGTVTETVSLGGILRAGAM